MTTQERPRSLFTPVDLAAVAFGGAIGTLLRAGMTWISAPAPGEIPWGTAGENLLGAFLLGIVIPSLLRRARGSHGMRLFLTTGVLGSFTTFSGLAVDAVHLFEVGASAGVGVYLLISIPGGILVAWLGLHLGRSLPRQGDR